MNKYHRLAEGYMNKVLSMSRLPKAADLGGYKNVKMDSYSPESLQEWMNLRSLDQKALAEKAGVSEATIHKLLVKRASPTDKTLKKLGRALNVLFVSDWVAEDMQKGPASTEDEAC